VRRWGSHIREYHCFEEFGDEGRLLSEKEGGLSATTRRRAVTCGEDSAQEDICRERSLTVKEGATEEASISATSP
jgi:hypothetical protein